MKPLLCLFILCVTAGCPDEPPSKTPTTMVADSLAMTTDAGWTVVMDTARITLHPHKPETATPTHPTLPTPVAEPTHSEAPHTAQPLTNARAPSGQPIAVPTLIPAGL